MPRFNSKRWSPVSDSTPGLRTVDPKRVVLKWVERPSPWSPHDIQDGCPCGCGEFPLGRNATFCMGHDARLRGILIRAHLTGTEIRYVDFRPDVEDSIDTAMSVAADHGWQHYLDAAVLRREGKNREVLQRALGSRRLVQVGRWEYTGQVAAVYRDDGDDMFDIEYVTKSGDVRRIRVPADETIAVS